MRGTVLLFALTAFLVVVPSASSAQSAVGLKGGRASIELQYSAATEEYGLTIIRTSDDVTPLTRGGILHLIVGNRDYEIHEVSYPFALHPVKTFIEELAKEYHQQCEEKLVVTSLTRPVTEQPWNASEHSVHPTGIAVDLRLPWNWDCRNWFENRLLSLEARGVVEATRERWPPHYHVAVFPNPLIEYLNTQVFGDRSLTYEVRRGDTLWRIATMHEVTVQDLMRSNGLMRDIIHAGQELLIPIG